MKNNVIGLKNYASILRGRLLNKELIEEKDYIGLLESIMTALESIEKEFVEHEKRLSDLEARKTIPSNQSNDEFIKSVVAKIVILKNIILKKLGNPDEQMFSFNLTTVETIEKEIIDSGTVTKYNLEKLNKIYLAEKGRI